MKNLPPALEDALRNGGEKLTALVIRLGALGDILRTIPAVRLLRKRMPWARLIWVVDDRWRIAVDGLSELDEVLPLPRREWREGGWIRTLSGISTFRSALRDRRPDLAIDFHGNLRSGLVSWLSGAPVRLGYAGHQQKECNRWFTTHRVAAGERRTPRTERNQALVRALGVPDAPLPVGALPLADAGVDEARKIMEETCGPGGAAALISPGVSVAQAHKRPPPRLLAAAARRLAGHGLTPLIVWGPGEEDDARQVVELAADAAVLAPPTNLPTLAALLARSRLYIGGDSGPLHMACAMGCPVIGIYGPTDPAVNGPWGVPCRAVFPGERVYSGIKGRDRTAGGFRGLDERQVDRAVDELLAEIAGSG